MCVALHELTRAGLRRLEQTQKLCWEACPAFLFEECLAPTGESLVTFRPQRPTTSQARSDESC